MIVIKDLVIVVLSILIGIEIGKLFKKVSKKDIEVIISNGIKLYPKKTRAEVVQTIYFFSNQLNILTNTRKINIIFSEITSIFKDECNKLGIDLKRKKKDVKATKLDNK